MTEQVERILRHGIRNIQIDHQAAVWCIWCNCFIGSNPDESHSTWCPYRALETSQLQVNNLKAELRNERRALLNELFDADKITTEAYAQAMDEIDALKEREASGA